MQAPDWGQRELQAIEAAVLAVNAGLAKPAQIRRWAILAGSLTVENGFLTGSMKVRRAYVAGQMAAVIEAIYTNEASPAIRHLWRSPSI
jgi:long-chain acyl-CoA synthetase